MSSIRGFRIAWNGLAQAEIIVEEKANPAELFAAEELQKYVREISNITLPIKKKEQILAEYSIFIGKSEKAKKSGINLDNKKTDGFAIKTINKDLFLVGNNPRATLYAVYHLLESLGCRWYEPGKVGEVVPRMKEITLQELDITEKPDFDTRSFWLMYLDKDDMISVIDWMAKNKMNWVYCDNNATPYDDYILPIADEFEKRGMQIELGSHTLTPSTFGLDPKLLESKPECFALVDGKRGGGASLRICYTNPKARHLIGKNIIEFCKERPEIRRSTILFQDGVTGWCECEKCRAIQPDKMDPLWNLPKVSDLYAYFIDKLTSEIKGKLPQMEFSMFACYTAREVPENPDFLPKNPNVYVVLDHYERCHTHPLSQGGCEKNSVIKKDNLKWRMAYPGKFWFWDMAAGTFDYDIGMVSPLTNLIKDSISFGKQLKISGMVTNWEDSQSLPSNQYWYARLLWNAELDTRKTKEEFFQKYYGPAKEIMREYAQEFGEYPYNFKPCTGHRDYRALLAHLKPEKLSKLKKLLELAEQRVNKKEYQDRLKHATERLELLELWRKLEDTLDEALKIAGKEKVHKADHLFFTKGEKEEEKRVLEIDFHKIQQLEKKAENLFFLITEHRDPANKKTRYAMRKAWALRNYNKVRCLGIKEDRHLHNGGFEEGEKYFIPSWEEGGWALIDSEVSHSGRKSLHFSNSTSRGCCAIKQKVVLNQKKPRAIRFGGWHKTEKIEGSKDNEFSLNIHMLTNKEKLLKEEILLEPGTHSWQKVEKLVHPSVPIKELTFFIMLYRRRGKAWFDDLFLEET